MKYKDEGKKFWKWFSKKKELDHTKGTALFHAREVWWCALGTNIGFEQDGSGELFTRPVIILSKFSLDSCLIVPLTSQPKKGKYYFPLGDISGREAIAILSQIRFIDRKRLAVKISTIEKNTFDLLIQAIVHACFPNFCSLV